MQSKHQCLSMEPKSKSKPCVGPRPSLGGPCSEACPEHGLSRVMTGLRARKGGQDPKTQKPVSLEASERQRIQHTFPLIFCTFLD